MNAARVNSWNSAHPSGTPVLAWPGEKTGEPLVTRTRHSAWLLGSGEPVVRVVGHAGGIHLDHIEHDPTRQPAVPDVQFEAPPCPICGDGLEGDADGLTCLGCRVSWSKSGERGEWHDPQARRCPATRRAYPTIAPDDLEQCILAADHDGDLHRPLDGIGGWTDQDRDAVIDSDGEAIE